MAATDLAVVNDHLEVASFINTPPNVKEVNTSAVVTGAVLDVKEVEEGVYEVTQLDQWQTPPPSNEDANKPVNFSWGIFRISGYINTSTFAFDLRFSVSGINVGHFTGNLKKGLKININLIFVKGTITLFLKNGTEVWVSFKFTRPSINKEFLLFKI